MPSTPDLTTFKALSFDCYSTLIDEDVGMLRTLDLLVPPPQAQGNRRSSSATTSPQQLLEEIYPIILSIERTHPSLPYNEVLAEAITQVARNNSLPITDSIAEPFGNSPGTWPPFADTVTALQKLKKYYKLVILSNVDNVNIRQTVENRLEGVEFDAVYTAQDIGSYKPDLRNFEYMFGHLRKELGVDFEKGEVCHVANSLGVDHVPAKKLGLRSVWISKGKDEEGELEKIGDGEKTGVGFEWKFRDLGDFATEVERQFGEKTKK